MTSLTHKTTIGVFWNLLQQLASRGITVLVTLVLAYYLAPEDFGLVAMMAAMSRQRGTMPLEWASV